MSRGFVVLDFETTGLAPARGDRVLEVGAVELDAALHVGGELETLVNPQRDVGPTSIHGVTARDVFDAPTFDRVAPALLSMLDGRVVVGHNVAFDLRFLAAELEREGYEAPEFVAIDTLQVARSLLRNDPPPSYKLHDITAHLGFGIADVFAEAGLAGRPEHSALGDAMVTATLLARFVELSPTSAYWSDRLARAAAVAWPDYVPVPAPAKRRGDPGPAADAVGRAGTGASVGEVLTALGAASPAPAATAEYTRLLDDSLADRVLDSDEIDALVATADALGLDGVTLGSLHRGQFDQVVRAAWADGVLTEEERADIRRVAELLGIDADSVAAALSGGAAVQRDPATAPAAVAAADGTAASAQAVALAAGALIVLTGELSVERSLVEAELVALGYAIGKAVTKKTVLVIAADPYTQSGKAKKARAYGIPVLGEADGLALVRGAGR